MSSRRRCSKPGSVRCDAWRPRLGLLLGITVDEETKVSRKRTKGGAWEWNPDWSAGYRANLAPLQRLGLLLFPVLTEDEMNSLLATG